MAKIRFNVAYEIVTEESAEYGDAEERGFISENVSLRDAFQDVNATRTNRVDGVECIENSGRWITIVNGMEYETGAQESRSIHPIGNITKASYNRLCKLLGAK